MCVIINLESASTNCSVSIYRGEQLLVLKEDRTPEYTHDRLLHVFMKEAMQEAGIKWSDLDAVAVSRGPGSYTGLRIGVAAAKGLCFALEIPLIAIPTLKSMACQVSISEGVLVPMLDARRMEVYAAIYDAGLKEVSQTRAEVINAESFSQWAAKGPVHLLGPGAEKCRELLIHPNFRYYTDVVPSAREMGPLAARRYRAGQFEDLAYFEPFYLKDFMGVKKTP